MRFNIISESGDGVGFAIELVRQGEDARVWIRDKRATSVGDGLVEKVGDVEDFLHDADPMNDIFIFDSTGNGIIADHLQRMGFPVLGDSILADRLERDRDYGIEIMKQAGLDTPETAHFEDFDKAIDFVRERNESRWVYKPSKQLAEDSMAHVSYDTEDLVEFLTNVKNATDIEDIEFDLQEFRKGLAISTELWFDRGHLLPLTNHTLERKEAWTGDLGPSGGCSGNVVWVCDGCPLCDNAKKLVPLMRREQYHGMIDLNVILAEDGVYGLEFTPRFGYDAGPTFLMETIENSLGQFLSDMARGQLYKFGVREGFAAALRVTVPPYPTEKADVEEDVPIRGIELGPHVFGYNVKTNDSGLCTAGAWGILLLLTSHSETLGRAYSAPYRMAEQVRVKGKQYRTDLVEVFKKDVEKLQQMLEVV